MIFVSRYSELRIPILTERRKPIGNDAFGNVIFEEQIPSFTAEFKPGHLAKEDRYRVFKHFRDLGYGAFTHNEDGYSDQVGFYVGANLEFALGVFDTENLNYVPENIQPFRELVEQRLSKLAEEDAGRTFVKIEAESPTPPWPNYDTIDGRSLPKVLEKIAEDGYSLLEILAYERATKNRESWIRAFEDALGAAKQKRDIEAALSVTI